MCKTKRDYFRGYLTFQKFGNSINGCLPAGFRMDGAWSAEEGGPDEVWVSGSNRTYDNESIYDEYDDLYDVPAGLIALLSICYGSISILAVVGNALVIWIVATSRRMQSVTNCFIANLALADIVIGLFAIPFQFQAALLQRWNLPYFMCAFCPFVQVLSVNVSVFTLTAIAVDRHRAILKPLSARPSKFRAKVVIASIWFFGGALAAPMAVALRVIMTPDNSGVGRHHLKPFCRNEKLSESSMLIYRALLGFLQYLTPLFVISCVYARMALRLWGSRAPGNAQDSRDANLMKNKKKVIKMLVIVVALFAVCWLPLQTYNVLQYTYPEINEYRYINIIWFCCDWLAMSNSCYNPFIYGIYNEKFKREFQQRCPFRPRQWSTSPPMDSLDLDKTQSTRTSIRFFFARYDWRRPASGGCPAAASFYRGVSVRGPSRLPAKGIEATNRTLPASRCCVRNGNATLASAPKSPNTAAELYVFASGRHKHTNDFNSQELCL
ncbi:RYamide receptor-like isoform X1 [Neodiprion fabricii]|uniref:RYamide receptor-like isoform X1 n=1 Tax=Neodiprion fabricii TaxID=2872261 RepID=UPI001ED974F7|nr:RYamide receptor-like isoform X1 [Neodiprion fabricii]